MLRLAMTSWQSSAQGSEVSSSVSSASSSTCWASLVQEHPTGIAFALTVEGGAGAGGVACKLLREHPRVGEPVDSSSSHEAPSSQNSGAGKLSALVGTQVDGVI